MTELSHLLTVADAYMAATSTKEVTLSHRLFRDSKKLTALREGADITLGRFNSAMLWFAENWPEGLEWPSEVANPEAPRSPRRSGARTPSRVPAGGAA